MNVSKYYLLFTLGKQIFALHVSKVDRVAPIVEITPLPKAPDIVLGVVNVHGQIIPVINMRRRFSFPEQEASLSDHLLICKPSQRNLALLVNDIQNITAISEKSINGHDIMMPGVDYINGAAKLQNRIVLIHDLNTLLSLEEEQAIDKAIPNFKMDNLSMNSKC